MFTNSRLLLADKFFLDAMDQTNPRLVSVFPGASDDGAYRAGYEELKKRGALQSAFYKQMLPELVRIFGNLAPATLPALETLLRPVLVTLTSLFIDRSIRVAHRLHQAPEIETRVAEVLPKNEFMRLDHLRNQSSSHWHFNQAMIKRIAKDLGIGAELYLHPEDYPESPVRPAQRNLLMGPPSAGALLATIGRVKNRLLLHLRQTPSVLSRYASLGFSGDDYFLSKQGFYGPIGLFNFEKKFDFINVSRNLEMRSKLQYGMQDDFPNAMKTLFVQVAGGTLSIETCDQLSKSFPSFFADYFPLNFLEGLESNLQSALDNRKKSRASHLIGADMVTDDAYFMAAATKMLGGKVIGVQHGGHYGYIEQMSLMAEFEYALYDTMITWGWTAFDANLPATKALPLPSPRLSSKPIKYSANLSKSQSVDKGKEVLLMTNLLRRFANISTCGQARVDFLEETLACHERLVKNLVGAGIRVDHKPYSQSVVDLVPEHFAQLMQLGGERYRLLESKQKGLSPDLLKGYQIVLWDQIGTGTLDCFVTGIPTMILWERIFSRESSQARLLIAELERVGVVHSSSESLSREMKSMLANPNEWMNNEARQAAIRNFCNRFALTDRRWPSRWRQALRLIDEVKIDDAAYPRARK